MYFVLLYKGDSSAQSIQDFELNLHFIIAYSTVKKSENSSSWVLNDNYELTFFSLHSWSHETGFHDAHGEFDCGSGKKRNLHVLRQIHPELQGKASQ